MIPMRLSRMPCAICATFCRLVAMLTSDRDMTSNENKSATADDSELRYEFQLLKASCANLRVGQRLAAHG